MRLLFLSSATGALAAAIISAPPLLRSAPEVQPPHALQARQNEAQCASDLAQLANYADQVRAYVETFASYASQFAAAQQPLVPQTAAQSAPASLSQATPTVAAGATSAASSAAATQPAATNTLPVHTAAANAPIASTASAQPSGSVAASGTAAASGAAPAGTAAAGAAYKQYNGDGTTKSGWPDFTSWYPSLDAMVTGNAGVLNGSCASLTPPEQNNSADEIQALQSAISAAANEAGLDPRFVLAVALQESGGCVRVKTTTSPGAAVSNPGVLQDHSGSGTCNSGSGAALVPCPSSQITQMVRDGVLGTAAGDGLKQVYASSTGAGASGVQAYYQAARRYNSGSADAANLGDGKGATDCYASDVANRLTGWTTGATKCTLSG